MIEIMACLEYFFLLVWIEKPNFPSIADDIDLICMKQKLLLGGVHLISFIMKNDVSDFYLDS